MPVQLHASWISLMTMRNASVGMAPLLFGACRYQQKVLTIGNELATDYLERLGPHTSVHLLLMRGIANYGVGEFKAAWEQTKAAYALDDNMPCTHENALGGGDPAIIARGYASLSGLALGYLDQCLSLIREALEIARKRNHAFTVAWALFAAARIYRQAGRFDEALSSGNEAIALCERYGFRRPEWAPFCAADRERFTAPSEKRSAAWPDIRRGLQLWRTTSKPAFTCPTF